METFPAQFPAPSRNLSTDMAANTVRTNMDSGLVRQRRRFSTELFTLGVTWEFSDTEMGIFAAWHKYKVNLGCDWFMMPLPVGGGGFQNHIVRFTDGKYTQSYQDVGYWDVTAKLEVQTRYVYDEAVLDFYLGIGFSESELTNLIAAANAFHYCVHVTLFDNLN